MKNILLVSLVILSLFTIAFSFQTEPLQARRGPKPKKIGEPWLQGSSVQFTGPSLYINDEKLKQHMDDIVEFTNAQNFEDTYIMELDFFDNDIEDACIAFKALQKLNKQPKMVIFDLSYNYIEAKNLCFEEIPTIPVPGTTSAVYYSLTLKLKGNEINKDIKEQCKNLENQDAKNMHIFIHLDDNYLDKPFYQELQSYVRTEVLPNSYFTVEYDIFA